MRGSQRSPRSRIASLRLSARWLRNSPMTTPCSTSSSAQPGRKPVRLISRRRTPPSSACPSSSVVSLRWSWARRRGGKCPGQRRGRGGGGGRRPQLGCQRRRPPRGSLDPLRKLWARRWHPANGHGQVQQLATCVEASKGLHSASGGIIPEPCGGEVFAEHLAQGVARWVRACRAEPSCRFVEPRPRCRIVGLLRGLANACDVVRSAVAKRTIVQGIAMEQEQLGRTRPVLGLHRLVLRHHPRGSHIILAHAGQS